MDRAAEGLGKVTFNPSFLRRESPIQRGTVTGFVSHSKLEVEPVLSVLSSVFFHSCSLQPALPPPLLHGDCPAFAGTPKSCSKPGPSHDVFAHPTPPPFTPAFPLWLPPYHLSPPAPVKAVASYRSPAFKEDNMIRFFFF